jgi:hypothetical protein
MIDFLYSRNNQIGQLSQGVIEIYALSPHFIILPIPHGTDGFHCMGYLTDVLCGFAAL